MHDALHEFLIGLPLSVVNDEGRDIFVVDAHRDDGKRYIVRSDEKLTAFLETEEVTRDASGH